MPVRKDERRKVLFLCCLVVFVSLFVLSIACADEGQVTEPAPVTAQDYRQELRKTITVEEDNLAHNLDSYVRFMPFSGAKGQSGKVGVVAGGSEYNYKFKAFGKLPIELGIISQYIGINNSTAIKLPAKLTSLSFGMQTTVPFFSVDKTYFTVGLAPSFYGQNWNFSSSSFSLMQRYFMIYQPNEKLTLVMGLSYEPGFKPSVFPIAGLIYRPDDRLTFNLIGSNPEISYALNKKWTLFAEGECLFDEYKVTRDNANKNVTLNYNEIRAGGGVRYTLNKNVEGSLSVGSVFGHAIEYRQDSLGKVGLENGFYSEFRLSIMM